MKRSDSMLRSDMKKDCSHDVHYLGEQKGEKGANRYYRCPKCGCVLVKSDDGVIYEIPKGQEE